MPLSHDDKIKLLVLVYGAVGLLLIVSLFAPRQAILIGGFMFGGAAWMIWHFRNHYLVVKLLAGRPTKP